MEYRKLGDSDLELSVITFGAWAAGGWMWGGNEESDAIDAIRASYDLGVTSIDTAPVYGMGKSEEIVAKAIKGISRDKIQIVTKYGMRWDLPKGDFYFASKDNDGNDLDIYKYSGKESIIDECENSLRRLGTDYIDLYQVHWYDKTTPIQESMVAVDQLIKEGKVRSAGVCNYNLQQFQEAEKHVHLVSNQMPYSMVERKIEDELLPYLIDNNKSLLAYSPLQRGLLTGKMKAGQTFSDGDHRAKLPHFKKNNIISINEFLDMLKPMAADKGATLSQLVLRWTVEQPGISIALAGARNAEQSVMNAKSMDVKLSADEISLITEQLNKLELDL
ncbi:MAG: aldo/keto reductase [Cyclobacteriaceae bacterium]